MDKSEAINLARMEVIGNFKVLDVEGLSREEEENVTIKLADDPHLEPYLGTSEGARDGQEVYYVTLGWDSIIGDGSFKVTCRIVADPVGEEMPVAVADYLAQL
jgi:hypothetical protein